MLLFHHNGPKRCFFFFGQAGDQNEAMAELKMGNKNRNWPPVTYENVPFCSKSCTSLLFVLWFIYVYSGGRTYLLENCFGNLKDGWSLSIRNKDSDFGTEKRGLKVTLLSELWGSETLLEQQTKSRQQFLSIGLLHPHKSHNSRLPESFSKCALRKEMF